MVKSNIVFRVAREKILYIILLVFLLLIKSFAYSQDVESLMREADELYSQREELAKAKEAYFKYEDIIKTKPENFDAYWKLIRTIWYIEEFFPSPTKKGKLSMFEKGIQIAKKSIEIAPERAEGYFWLAVMYGVYGETRGIIKSLFLVNDIKESLNKSLAIDPTLEEGGAYRILGRMDYKLPTFIGGSLKRSLEYLLKSKEISPTAPWTYIYLADTYLALKNKEMAKNVLTEFIDMPLNPKWIPETKRYKKVAEEMLREIEGKK